MNQFDIDNENNIISIINPYKYKPILIQNYLRSNFYKDSLYKLFSNKKLNKNCHEKPLYNTNTKKFKSYADKIIDGIVINCIYFNKGGYNFIEIIDHFNNDKITVYIVPSQTGNSGKYLTTNGTAASWATIVTDPTPTVLMLGGM
jgi:hypothetical protein